MKGGFDRTKSLQDLENHDWGKPSINDTSLVTRCLRLRRKPLKVLTSEDLRIMIGQSISLPILIPLAVERLEEEPLAETSYHPGNLLKAVLRADESFWSNHPASLNRVCKIFRRVKVLLPSVDETYHAVVLGFLEKWPLALSV